MSLNRLLTYASAGLLLIVAVFFAYWYWNSQMNDDRKNITLNDPSGYLERNNADYRQALISAQSQDWTNARYNYQRALEQATNYSEEAQIKFRLAATEERIDTLAAIPLYKEIIGNDNYPDIHRAYAAERLASMYYINNRHLLSEEDFAAIRNETFKDEPYKSMADGEDTELAYRRLFEYASSFRPLAISQSFIALWYANTILEVREGKIDPPPGYDEGEYLDVIAQATTNVEADISRTKDDRNANNLILHATYRLARVTAKLALAGLMDPNDVQVAYTRVFNVYDGLKISYSDIIGWDGFIRVDYLKYLLQQYHHGEETELIATLMRPIYQNWVQSYLQHDDFSNFISKEHDDLHGAKWAFVTYANTDPEFKDFLIRIGWDESDFSEDQEVPVTEHTH